MAPPQAPHRFEVLQLLGRGGMGEVSLARMSERGRSELVALKRMRAAPDETGRLQFEREAQVGQLLTHENIVQVRAYGVDAKGPYLALEYVEGCSLRQLLRSRAAANGIPLAATLSIAEDVARALAHAHALRVPELGVEGVIHRDVTPENVLLHTSGIAKLSDFGIARMGGVPGLTTTGTLKGKHGFMAPELFDGQDSDVLTDLFSLGVTLYHLLCGVAPFRGKTEAQLMRAVLTSEPAPVTLTCPDAPPPLAEWIHAALSRDRKRRPGTADSLREIIEQVRGHSDSLRPAVAQLVGAVRTTTEQARGAPLPLPVTAARTLPARYSGRRRQVSFARAAGAGALVLLVAVTGLIVSMQRDDRESSTTSTAEASPGAPSPDVSHAGALAATDVAVPIDEGSSSGESVPTAISPSAASLSAQMQTAADADAAGAPLRSTGESARTVDRTKRPSTLPSARATRQSGAPSSQTAPTRRTASRSRKVAEKPAPSSSFSEDGSLWVKVWPWADVFIDGKLIGRTPLEPHTLSSGAHSVILVNEARGERRSMTVRIKPGEERVLRVDLTKSADPP